MTKGLRRIMADLHIHTALSPCGDEEMTPPAIVAAALEAGLDMIAVCDHNSTRNVTAVQEAAKAAGGRLAVLAGMEINSAEEVHVVGLFPDAEAAQEASEGVRTLLPPADADYYSFFGEQHVLAADGSHVANETVSLSMATPLALEEVVALIKRHDGLAVAAHVDRRAFGVLSQLGCFPEAAGFDGVEVSRHTASDAPSMEGYRAFGLPVTGSSDAHYLEDIGSAKTILTVAKPIFAEVALAFAGVAERRVDRA